MSADTVLCVILNPTFFRPDAAGEELYSQVVLWLSTVDVGLGEKTGLPTAALPCFLADSLYSSQVLPVIEVSSLKIMVKKLCERSSPLST